jgi:hypothetical protein
MRGGKRPNSGRRPILTEEQRLCVGADCELAILQADETGDVAMLIKRQISLEVALSARRGAIGLFSCTRYWRLRQRQ